MNRGGIKYSIDGEGNFIDFNLKNSIKKVARLSNNEDRSRIQNFRKNFFSLIS